ncbi:uncharacterized protein LOC116352330 [Contarinia nasturtii]|uniref:uncharacterized protein LOC116352330 n=1 Tax=Contarinia nasturtii TaxID=265458 RepID=UPI0012D4A897|nr:uncharacterized protein LOC116352330 [Contarinia nasturtii]
MSALMKNLHVHFDDEVLSESAAKKRLDDELKASQKAMVGITLNYSREKLLEFGQSKASKEPPKMFDLSGADDKRMEKIRHVLKNSDILKSRKSGASDAQKDQARSNFQQMISAAVSNAQQQNGEYASNRRRIGSGRIVDNFNAQDNVYAIGMDVRYMRNKLFKEDGKVVKNWKHSEMVNQTSDTDNADSKSDEPEWANCGPISKHDIIELHGFDGPEDEDTQKSESVSVSPPARNSTPSKTGSMKSANNDEHFNFEDFLKLDLPPSVNCSRDLGTGESRFSQWFGRDKPTYPSGKFTAGTNTFDTKSTQQFFDYHQKANQKKTNVPNKLRSVDELEADWCPPNQAKQQEQNGQQTDINAIRMMLNQLATSTVCQKQNSMNAAQTNFLLNLINKSAETLYQHRLSQNATMKRPDAQLLLHRLVNGEITQYHILQQIGNPTVHQHDRETFLAVFAFCNENQQWLLDQQQQQLKQKEQMSRQLRQLQMIQMKNGNMQSPTPQELQIHTQAIMQNALQKKQFEDQYRNLQSLKIGGNQPKFQSYKSNNFMANNQPYNNNRFGYKHQKQSQFGQNGLQFIQSQNKSMWNRQGQVNMPFMGGPSANSGVRNNDFMAYDTTGRSMGLNLAQANADKMPITVDK